MAAAETKWQQLVTLHIPQCTYAHKVLLGFKFKMHTKLREKCTITSIQMELMTVKRDNPVITNLLFNNYNSATLKLKLRNTNVHTYHISVTVRKHIYR